MYLKMLLNTIVVLLFVMIAQRFFGWKNPGTVVLRRDFSTFLKGQAEFFLSAGK